MKKINIIHPDFLVNLNLPENVYFLGRFWADGHLSKNSVVLHGVTEDICHLFDFLNRMGIFTIYTRQAMKNGRKFGREASVIHIASKQLVEFLHQLDGNKKSIVSPSKILNLIAPELQFLFWRGFFDGDGSLYFKHRFSCAFWGTFNQDWSCLEALLTSLGVSFSKTLYSRKQGKHKSSTIEMRKGLCIKTFLNYLYQDLIGISMPRKFKKFEQFMKVIASKNLKPITNPKGVILVKNRWRATVFPTKSNNLKKPIVVGGFRTQQEAIDARTKILSELNLSIREIKKLHEYHS